MVSTKILKMVAAIAAATAVTIGIGVGLSGKKDANLRLASSASQAQWNDGDLFVNEGGTVNGTPTGVANNNLAHLP